MSVNYRKEGRNYRKEKGTHYFAARLVEWGLFLPYSVVRLVSLFENSERIEFAFYFSSAIWTAAALAGLLRVCGESCLPAELGAHVFLLVLYTVRAQLMRRLGEGLQGSAHAYNNTPCMYGIYIRTCTETCTCGGTHGCVGVKHICTHASHIHIHVNMLSRLKTLRVLMLLVVHTMRA